MLGWRGHPQEHFLRSLDPGNSLQGALQVGQRRSLPLRDHQTIHLFNMNKAAALPFPQPRTSFLTGWESRDDPIVKMTRALGDPFQKSSEEEGRTKMASSVQTAPSALWLEFLRGTPSNDNYRSPEVPTLFRRTMTSLGTTHGPVGRDRHSDTVLESCTGNPEPGSNLVKGGYEPQERDVWPLETPPWLSAWVISVASWSPGSKGAGVFEEAK